MSNFEIYQDEAGEYRWRMRSGGDTTADSGEGYASKDGAREAVNRIKEYAPDADVLEVGRAAFEVYEDKAGEFRWRLVHRNGNILADSGEGYSSKSGARQAVKNVKEDAPGADTEE